MDKTWLERISEILFYTFLGMLIAYGITRMISPVNVIGNSMDPTLISGQKKVMNRTAYLFSEPEFGDVIVFKPADDLKVLYLKRVIGLPGDSVEIRNNDVYVNDVIIIEDYIKESMDSEDFKRYVLKEDEYFVLGDNRNNSRDSRYFGPVKKRHIMGKLFGNYPIYD